MELGEDKNHLYIPHFVIMQQNPVFVLKSVVFKSFVKVEK